MQARTGTGEKGGGGDNDYFSSQEMTPTQERSASSHRQQSLPSSPDGMSKGGDLANAALNGQESPKKPTNKSLATAGRLVILNDSMQISEPDISVMHQTQETEVADKINFENYHFTNGRITPPKQGGDVSVGGGSRTIRSI